MKSHVALVHLGLVCVALTTACSKTTDENNSGRGARLKADPTQQVAQDSVANNPLSDQECRAYARSVTEAVASGDPAVVNSLIDWNQVFNTALSGMEMTTKRRQDLMLDLRRGIAKDVSFTTQLIKNSEAGGSLDFLRARQNRGRQVMLFRMIQPIGTGGVGYFEVIPGRSADGKVRAIDVYVFSNGEAITTTLRHTLLPIIANESRSFIDVLISGERDFVHDSPQIVQMSKLINRGKAKDALAIAKNLKPETKKQKLVLLHRLRAAQSADDNEYSAVLEDFRTAYPLDPCLDLLLIDYYLMKKDYAHADESINRLDKAVGGDPYLNVMRSAVRTAAGDLKAARGFADRAIEAEPTLVSAYFAMLDISIEEGDHKKSLELLKKLDQTFKTKFDDLSTAPEYAGFVKSLEYKEWLQYLARKKTNRNPK